MRRYKVIVSVMAENDTTEDLSTITEIEIPKKHDDYEDALAFANGIVDISETLFNQDQEGGE